MHWHRSTMSAGSIASNRDKRMANGEKTARCGARTPLVFDADILDEVSRDSGFGDYSPDSEFGTSANIAVSESSPCLLERGKERGERSTVARRQALCGISCNLRNSNSSTTPIHTKSQDLKNARCDDVIVREQRVGFTSGTAYCHNRNQQTAARKRTHHPSGDSISIDIIEQYTERFDNAAEDLIGDFSRRYALPSVDGKHPDLKEISTDTLAELLCASAAESHKIRWLIVDCRYPYEYEAGHIRGACNIYTKSVLLRQFLTQSPDAAIPTDHQTAIVFHCEFSSKRGPAMARFLRKCDRSLHSSCYPTLRYPELYVLNGGYREFYERHAHLCVPQKYLPMVHLNYRHALRYFRSVCKKDSKTVGELTATSSAASTASRWGDALRSKSKRLRF